MCLNGGELYGHRFISKATMDSMVIRRSSKSSFGIGWYIYDNGSYGHNGAYNTDMTIHPSLGLVSISLVQVTPSHKCRSILREKIWEEENINELKK
jgi:CubicO group peptidase (beta-lactamase class C family)